MSVKKLSDNKFRIDYYPQGRKGKRVQETFYGTEAEAREYELICRRQYAGSASHIVNPKVVDIIPEYLEWANIHLAPKTVQDVKWSLKWLLPIFGHLQFSRITPHTIEKFKQSRVGKNRATNKELVYLQSIIKYAVKHGHANPLPFKIEKVPYKRKIPRIPHPKDVTKLLKAIEGSDAERKKALLLFMWECGLRWCEASKIKWENIDWLNGIVYVFGKGSRERISYMTPNIKELLEPLKQESGWVFENPKTGKPWTTFKRSLKTACRRANVPHIRPHLLRHGFGTYSLEATGDLRLVQTLLGHKDISTTQFYTQIAANRLKIGTKKTASYVAELEADKGGD